MEIFNYASMCRAFMVGILLTAVIPYIGIVIIYKRLSMIGDALSHCPPTGVAAGLILGVNPVAAAAAACVIATFGIEAVRRKLPVFSEMPIAVIMSAGIGLAGVLSGFVKNATNFNNFLFGSIMAIGDGELYLVMGVSVAVLLVFLPFYKELFYVSLDEQRAGLAGVLVKTVNFLLAILTTLTIPVAARTVGTLVISSMMMVPVACVMELGRNYRQTLLCAVMLNVVFMVIGLFAACYLGLKPGSAIILVGMVCLVLVLSVKRLLRKSCS